MSSNYMEWHMVQAMKLLTYVKTCSIPLGVLVWWWWGEGFGLLNI